MSSPIDRGFSWTTDFNTALWFAAKGEGKRIWKGKIKKKDVLFYVDARNEKEIIARPSLVESKSVLDMYPGDKNTALTHLSDVYDNYLQYGEMIKTVCKDYNNTNLHSVEHTARVLLNCLLIADNIGITRDELNILAYAAIFHDVGRKK